MKNYIVSVLCFGTLFLVFSCERLSIDDEFVILTEDSEAIQHINGIEVVYRMHLGEKAKINEVGAQVDHPLFGDIGDFEGQLDEESGEVRVNIPTQTLVEEYYNWYDPTTGVESYGYDAIVDFDILLKLNAQLTVTPYTIGSSGREEGDSFSVVFKYFKSICKVDNGYLGIKASDEASAFNNYEQQSFLSWYDENGRFVRTVDSISLGGSANLFRYGQDIYLQGNSNFRNWLSVAKNVSYGSEQIEFQELIFDDASCKASANGMVCTNSQFDYWIISPTGVSTVRNAFASYLYSFDGNQGFYYIDFKTSTRPNLMHQSSASSTPILQETITLSNYGDLGCLGFRYVKDENAIYFDLDGDEQIKYDLQNRDFQSEYYLDMDCSGYRKYRIYLANSEYTFSVGEYTEEFYTLGEGGFNEYELKSKLAGNTYGYSSGDFVLKIRPEGAFNFEGEPNWVTPFGALKINL